jgi:hypothetical protein
MESTQNPNAPKTMSRGGQLLFGLILLIGYSVAFYFLIWPGFNKSLTTYQWKPITGKVVDYNTITHWGSSVMYNDDWSVRTEADDWEFELRMTYQYIVDGLEFEGSQVRWKLVMDDYKDLALYKGPALHRALKLVNKYKVQSDVQVYYNPDNPEEAVLFRGPGIKQVLIQLALLVIPFLGILLIAGSFKRS